MNARSSLVIGTGLLFLALGVTAFRLKSPVITAAARVPSAGLQSDRTAPRFNKPGLDDKIRVAFVLTDGAVMIDFAGPWETFQDVMLIPPGKTMKDMKMPFELYTVSGSKNPIHTSGGMTIVPDYTFDAAPLPRVVVIGAQHGDPKLADWLRQMDKRSEVVMSVCTGASSSARRDCSMEKKLPRTTMRMRILSKPFLKLLSLPASASCKVTT
jgi:hypothetical protein